MTIIEQRSLENNMKINKSKSAVMEFINRRKRKLSFGVGEKFLDLVQISRHLVEDEAQL